MLNTVTYVENILLTTYPTNMKGKRIMPDVWFVAAVVSIVISYILTNRRNITIEHCTSVDDYFKLKTNLTRTSL